MARPRNTRKLEEARSVSTDAPTSAVSGPPKSRADYVHDVLRREILDGSLAPGTPILQEQIGARLGVSITPVREALRRLESVGLITYETHYGAQVTKLSPEAATELNWLRTAVESLLARLAASKVTEGEMAELWAIHSEMQECFTMESIECLATGSRRLHTRIAEIGGPAMLAGHRRWIWDNYPVVQGEQYWQFKEIAEVTLAEHEALLQALESHDEELAERLMREHVEATGLMREHYRPADRG